MPAKMLVESDFLKSWSRGEAMREHIQYALALPVDGKQEQCDLWVGQRRRVHQSCRLQCHHNESRFCRWGFRHEPHNHELADDFPKLNVSA